MFDWLLAVLVIWILVLLSMVTVVVVMDFLVLGHHGRLDYIANLFRKGSDQERRKYRRRAKVQDKPQ